MLLAIRKRIESRDEGFTLIELLIVVIIIGILAAVAIPTFLAQRNRGFRAAVQSDLRNLAVEAETFYTDETDYTDFVIPADFGSAGVGSDGNITIEAQDVDSYCFEAFHTANPDEIWSIQPGNQLTQAACA